MTYEFLDGTVREMYENYPQVGQDTYFVMSKDKNTVFEGGIIDKVLGESTITDGVPAKLSGYEAAMIRLPIEVLGIKPSE